MNPPKMQRNVLPVNDKSSNADIYIRLEKRTCLAFVIFISLTIFITGSFTTLPLQIRSISAIYPQTQQPISNDTQAPLATPIQAEPQSEEPLSVTRRRASKDPISWLFHLRENSPHKRVVTERIGCREYDAGAQSCVYEGFVCINTTKEKDFGRPKVYFVNDLVEDNAVAYSDNWCGLRFQSADPRYFSTRHWPILNGTFSPQSSCLDAEFRTFDSLLASRLPKDGKGSDLDLARAGIKWLDSLWLVDLDYTNNDHNNHLVKDIIWMLDVALWQAATDLRPRPDESVQGDFNDTAGHLFAEGPRHVYLPQGEEDFIKQTKRDVNRLTYSMILQRDLSRLYPNFTAEEMKTNPSEKRETIPLLEAFPDLKKEERLVFHRDMREDNNTDLVCSPRFTSGSKMGNGANERVCRYMRRRAYELYGIQDSEKTRYGYMHFPQPPKRIVILQRHITRGIVNLDDLEKALRETFEKDHGVEVEVITTAKLKTAEDFVRIFSRAGVMITPHGSQSMGQIWMPRHR